MNKEEVKLLRLDTGILWPHYKGKKALSASTLTKILRDIEYSEIPKYILLRAAKRGKDFHETIQEFVQTGNHPSFINLVTEEELNNLDKKIYETINFFKKNKSLELGSFLGSEKLHYIFYKEELLATYIDLEFHEYVIELKSNSIKIKNDIKIKELKVGQDKILNDFNNFSVSNLTLLIFEVQLLIQYLCTNKNIYLLWSTGQGVVFNKFKPSDYSLKMLDTLIDLARNGDNYTSSAKKVIIEEIVSKYNPNRIEK